MGECCSLYGQSTGESHSNDNYSVAICSMQGLRKQMEDSYCIRLAFNNHPIYSLFAVFDGFNGCDAAQYLANHLIERLNRLNSLNNDQLIIDEINNMDKRFLQSNNGYDISSGSTLVFALIRRVHNIPNTSNTSISSIHKNNNTSSSSSTLSSASLASPEIDSISGNDAISPLIEEKRYEVRVFWVGDSKSIVIKNENGNNFEELTFDHCCSLETEKKRICNNSTDDEKTVIINNKIDGITTLSRSFGCYSMKSNKNLRDIEQKHICIAECKHILCKSNETLLIFSDGLTEKWNNKQLVKYYNFHWNQHKNYSNPMQNSLNYLCEQCIDTGSTDNITAISIKFR